MCQKLKSDNCITEKTYNELYPTGTHIGILYGLPKIHKSSIPFRPILSCINHYLYKIARFFTPFPTPISMSSFVIKDSFSFVQELLNADVNNNNVFMASFDVASLFTNIPVDETIDIISNHLFANSMYFEGFDCSQFTKLLSLSVKNSHFISNGHIYQQINGMAMGRPFVCQNLCLSMRNHGCIIALPLSNLLCINVTSMIVLSSSDPQTMYLSFFPTLTANIPTSSELEKDDELPFLDYRNNSL